MTKGSPLSEVRPVNSRFSVISFTDSFAAVVSFAKKGSPAKGTLEVVLTPHQKRMMRLKLSGFRRAPDYCGLYHKDYGKVLVLKISASRFQTGNRIEFDRWSPLLAKET